MVTFNFAVKTEQIQKKIFELGKFDELPKVISLSLIGSEYLSVHMLSAKAATNNTMNVNNPA